MQFMAGEARQAVQHSSPAAAPASTRVLHLKAGARHFVLLPLPRMLSQSVLFCLITKAGAAVTRTLVPPWGQHSQRGAGIHVCPVPGLSVPLGTHVLPLRVPSSTQGSSESSVLSGRPCLQ